MDGSSTVSDISGGACTRPMRPSASYVAVEEQARCETHMDTLDSVFMRDISQAAHEWIAEWARAGVHNGNSPGFRRIAVNRLCRCLLPPPTDPKNTQLVRYLR